MTRPTRAESQARTRALIVDAATRLFLRDGFQVTSLEQIGEDAGFTRGAVYSNFPSKTAMGIAVIDPGSGWVELLRVLAGSIVAGDR